MLVDREAMRRAAQWFIDNRPGSWASIRRLPDWEHLQQPNLSKLASSTSNKPAVSERTLNAMRRIAFKVCRDDEVLMEIVRATTRAEELQAIDGYRRWLKSRAERFVRNSGPHWNATRHELEPIRDPDVNDPVMFDPLFGGKLRGVALRRYHNLWSLFIHLNETEPTKGMLLSFGSEMMADGHEVDRQRVAFIRILEPLLEPAESAFIERQWEELSDAELVRFIRAGIQRERILLTRGSEKERARKVLEAGPTALRKRKSCRRSLSWTRRATKGSTR